jgi:DNA-binding MarR family transcriptional regulator
MTDTPTLNGQDIGQAERATRAVLDALLAETSTSFQSWVTLNVLATSGSVLEQDQLVQRITSGLKVGEPSVRATLDELTAAGLITQAADAHSGVELTAAGQSLYRRVRSGIDSITERLYGDLPAEDLAIAHRVLAIVTERANAELAR